MIFAQLFGFSAIGLTLFVFVQKKRNNLLLFKFIQDICWSTHYLLLDCYSAMATNLICAAREVTFKNKKLKEYKILPIIFIALYLGSAVLTWKNIFSIFPALSSVFSTVAFFMKKPLSIKLMIIPSTTCTLIYNIGFSHSLSVYIGICCTATSLAVSFIQYFIDKKRSTRNEREN